jgi:hypothetical protein
MTWSRAINSTGTQIGLTISILFVTVLLFGLVADPIINLYLDPYSTITSGGFRSKIEPILTDDDEVTWIEYFIKGLVSLGLLSFMKVLFAMSPRQWWHVRSTGILNGGNRSGTTGRDRVANISWIVVVIGIGTFLWVRTETPKLGYRLTWKRVSGKGFVLLVVERWKEPLREYLTCRSKMRRMNLTRTEPVGKHESTQTTSTTNISGKSGYGGEWESFICPLPSRYTHKLKLSRTPSMACQLVIVRRTYSCVSQ